MAPAITKPAIEMAPITGRVIVVDCNSAIETIILKQVVKLPLQPINRRYQYRQLTDYQ